MTETKTVERDMSVFTKQTMKNGIVKDKPGRRKLFAQYNETATATSLHRLSRRSDSGATS
ncbi:MAG TPA: hypothetical protein VFC29_07890 [Candidatus Limnocylindrales bacterium]|nr:hypothetical protein [Candidatus Limnocylindrales bacterium]